MRVRDIKVRVRLTAFADLQCSCMNHELVAWLICPDWATRCSHECCGHAMVNPNSGPTPVPNRYEFGVAGT